MCNRHISLQRICWNFTHSCNAFAHSPCSVGQPTRRKLANALQQEINIAECLLFNALLNTENLAVDFMDVSDLDTCL